MPQDRIRSRGDRSVGSGTAIVKLRTTQTEHSFLPLRLFTSTQNIPSEDWLMKLISSPCLVLHLFFEDLYRHRLAMKLNWGGKRWRCSTMPGTPKLLLRWVCLLIYCSHIADLLSGMYEDMMHVNITAQVPIIGSRGKGLLYGFKLFCPHCSDEKLPHLHSSLVIPLSLQGGSRKYSRSLPCL